jgi:hypothetical protein
MSQENLTTELTKFRRISIRDFVVHMAISLALGGGLAIVNHLVHLPPWISVCLISISILLVVGDAISIACISWLLRNDELDG